MYGKRSFGDAFNSKVSERVVSIIAKEVGFQGIQPAALETLSNSLGSYLERLLIKSHLYAELGNRAKPNVHDITKSLYDAKVDIPSFEYYLSDTMTSKGKKYLRLSRSDKSTLESTPEFLPSDNEDSDEEEEQESIRPSYVSENFPTFPSKHSFRQTPIYIKRPDDPQKVRELNSEQSRTVEENLKKLMATENQILKESSGIQVIEDEYMMPIVNYEGFLQRRKKSKQKGTTLNVEGSNEPKINTTTLEQVEEEDEEQQQQMMEGVEEEVEEHKE
ncbi:hypothetical protein G6F56_005761 [Rhizopus delemar]|uniref:Transcription initiation factor TFIID subunit 8 n=1 Tax=Rhizopus stolonifer TaxID=4846 RepID=A0A367KT54_RHIST|nr:hypothetical protein G6F56_005761 [Rhizopus delemar]RCI05389.1 transcription initiation factor TFIID subunit 8 [Rhizopus stolonifer]